ncbi:MAG: carbohydrate ABC transporter permease [Actinobacteria bacterium]|nr:carbohydrate ABC transporter permease [Actinomycetota bacterium]
MRKLKTIVRYIFICLFGLFFFFPIYWLLNTSFKIPKQIFVIPPYWFPTIFTLDNYKLIFGWKGNAWGVKVANDLFIQNVLPFLRNSLIIAVSSSLIAVILGGLLGYGMSRYKFGGKNFYTWLLSMRMLPPIVVVIPMFMIFSTIHLRDNILSIIIAYLLINIPFATVLLFGFFNDVPRSLSDAALVDGCSPYGSFFRITLPIVANGMVAVFTISLITAWNELLIASALSGSSKSMTFTVYTTFFQQVERGTNWGPAAAAGIVGIIPVVILTFYVQKYLVRGLTLGAVKE